MPINQELIPARRARLVRMAQLFNRPLEYAGKTGLSRK
jgi:hypothetical protein